MTDAAEWDRLIAEADEMLREIRDLKQKTQILDERINSGKEASQ